MNEGIRVTTALLLAVTLTAMTHSASANTSKVCKCRAIGGIKVDLGTTMCLKTPSGYEQARCQYVLNNTAWIFTGRSCGLG